MGIGTPCGASGSGDGARDRHDHYRVRAGAFQGAGARFRRGAGGVHVVEQKDRRRNLAASRRAERPFDVFVPQDPGKPRLGIPLPDSGKRHRIEREADTSRKAGSDQRGEVESPPEIFPGMGRYRNHGRKSPVRDQVPPSPRERLVEAQGHRVDGVGATRVFRPEDRRANVSRVGEEGARGVERGRGGGAEAAGGRMRTGTGTFEGAAPGARRTAMGGPPGDGRGRKVRGCARQKVPERRELTDPLRRGEARPFRAAARLLGDLRGFSGGWRRRRTPGFRGRWRTRSMSRRRGTARST